MEDKDKGVSRRHFIETAALTGAGLTIVPRHVLGKGFTPPSDLLNIAAVGVGGMGRNNMRAVGSQNIVALCDVDWDFAGRSLDRFTTDLEQRRNPQAGGADAAGRARRRAAQSRSGPARRADRGPRAPGRAAAESEALHRLSRDARRSRRTSTRSSSRRRTTCTPPIALAAMDLGKHVYVQKPLCWSVEEARALAKKAKDNPKIATQMGNQGHSGFESRTTVEYIQQGAIGDIKEVHVWTNRPLGYWPQGLPRPNAAAMTAGANGQPPRVERPGRRTPARRGDGRATTRCPTS